MRLRRLALMSLLLFILGGCATTPPQVNRTVQLNPDLSLGFALPSDRWVVEQAVPEFLVEERAEHLEHELEAQGKKISRDELLQLARKRLAANELFIYNPQTKAVLEVDFSPLEKGESAPSKGTVANSARFAGDSLSQEEGVTDAVTSTEKAKVYGAMAAYRLAASYKLHDQDTQFVGVVGFAEPYWFYLYYTDPLKDARDLQEMDIILRNLLLKSAGAK